MRSRIWILSETIFGKIVGEKFDPNHHDAMMMIPESEEFPDNHVALVVQTGWTIGDRVLRAAKVGIAKKQ